MHSQLVDLPRRWQLEEDLVAHLLDVLQERLQHLLEVRVTSSTYSLTLRRLLRVVRIRNIR
jgi:hypothetical protein